VSGKRWLKLSWLQRSYLFSVGLLSAWLTSVPVNAAETIYFQYGQLGRSLQISSLQAFVETGEVRSDLQFYFNFLNIGEETQQRFRLALIAQADIDPVYLSRFLYTELGEDLLNQFGSYIRTEAGNNGSTALRAAVLLAATNSEGLSPLNILQQYPTDIRVDVQSSLSVAKAAGIVLDATDFFAEAIAQLSTIEAQTAIPVDFSQLPDLTQLGPYGAQRRLWRLRDEERSRSFYVDLYQPERWRDGQTPVIVISHGLASEPEAFARRAEYLASHGFVVAIPQHPGSDSQQVRDVVDGLERNIFVTQAFIDRPLDISYVLDELERRNATEFGGRLNLESVGAIGHSFGGYTVLSLAGATINFDNLQTTCQNNLEFLNFALLLQCRALDLPRQSYNLRDPRIQAVYALNPVNQAIFGQEGLSQITIPVMMEAGTHDPATPAVFEQVRSFARLTTPNKYLAILEGQAHVDFSNLDAGIGSFVESVTSFTLPPPDLLSTYSKSLNLAFFEVKLLGNEAYQPYLQASYTEYLSRDQDFGVFLITGASQEGLLRASEEFRSRL